jgi:hypothetical protein
LALVLNNEGGCLLLTVTPEYETPELIHLYTSRPDLIHLEVPPPHPVTLTLMEPSPSTAAARSL